MAFNGSWVTHRQNAKIAYFIGIGVSDKHTNKQTNSNFINIDLIEKLILELAKFL